MFHVVLETSPGEYREIFRNQTLVDRSWQEHPWTIMEELITVELAALGLHRVAHPDPSQGKVVDGWYFESGPNGRPVCRLRERDPAPLEIKTHLSHHRQSYERAFSVPFLGTRFSGDLTSLARINMLIEQGGIHRYQDAGGDFRDLTPDQLRELKRLIMDHLIKITAVEQAVCADIDAAAITTFADAAQSFSAAVNGTFTG